MCTKKTNANFEKKSKNVSKRALFGGCDKVFWERFIKK